MGVLCLDAISKQDRNQEEGIECGERFYGTILRNNFKVQCTSLVVLVVADI
jgi:hypothetical protein